MEIYRVSFIGHRVIYEDIEDTLQELVTDIMRTHQYVEFLVGRNGDFDISVAFAIKRAQKELEYKNSSLVLVLPYKVKDMDLFEDFYDEVTLPLDPKTHYKTAITARNKYMIDNSDMLIAFVKERGGGAYTTLKYAQSKGVDVINIFNFPNMKI